MKVINISIKNGDIKIDYQGFVGDECMTEEEKLKNALSKYMNIKVTSIELKPEYYEQQQSEQETEVNKQ